jgi:hypothetical protein
VISSSLEFKAPDGFSVVEESPLSPQLHAVIEVIKIRVNASNPVSQFFDRIRYPPWMVRILTIISY